MIKRIKQWIHNKYIGESGVYSDKSCADFIFVYINNIKNESDKVQFILSCMVSTDDTAREVIYDVVRDHYPQYNKVLINPDKYRILL